MIPKLIIGRRSLSSSEVFVSGDDSPENINKKLIELFGIVLDEEDDRQTDFIEFPDQTITTFSPYVISRFVKLCRIENGPRPETNVFLHFEGKDYRVTDFVEAAWLCHFDLGELYTDLELQCKLAEKLAAEG